MREADPPTQPQTRTLARALIAGLLFILPSIAVLTLLSIYTGDLWRMYVFVPFGAAIALMSLIVLVTAPVKRIRLRQTVVLCLSLLLILAGTPRLNEQQQHYRQNTDALARALRQIVEQAPGVAKQAHLMLYTSLSSDELHRQGVWQLQWNMLDSAIFMLYEGRGPKVAFLCISGEGCSRDDIHLQVGGRDFLGDQESYSDVVMFQLHDDMSLELLRALPPELRDREVNHYDPERLIDATAPLPPRARSLLASAWRD